MPRRKTPICLSLFNKRKSQAAFLQLGFLYIQLFEIIPVRLTIGNMSAMIQKIQKERSELHAEYGYFCEWLW
jgi:hypothetical protein